ncbi:hypothetical protein BU26DRAFT_521406 [Trematosphaeria pertusa]|uniref:Uncharacterized protein n=1 Tax=Trematosphaeria pertusa TaxID=390896 RepID=A0A6A6I8L9_9PLEO|nr:uncharacterized protein BU26DRAFT_521406 [Trematosphaeria pertusa]KAF2245863.1 hypothetical protein BU26DRAFT_521406 [Trematosphaeria pertusa]
MAILLPYTLQTYVGMIQNGGSPKYRRLPRKGAHLADPGCEKLSKALPPSYLRGELEKYNQIETVMEEAIKHVRRRSKLQSVFPAIYRDETVKRYAANLSACKSDVSKEDLKNYIRVRTRFDLEQAAAVVVSAFVKYGYVDGAVRLVRELGGVLAASCMWVEPNVPLPTQQAVFNCPESLARKLQLSAAKTGMEIPLAANYRELVPLLMRVRRCKPDTRCLNIPQWMFEEAGLEPPAHFKAAFCRGNGATNPVAPSEANSIILSRKHFRCDQRQIYRLFRYWKPDIRLRKSIKKLENKVLHGGSWIQQRALDTDDVALICYYFFHFQRRLQRKVVSDITGCSFLGKGEGAQLYQNNLAIKSTFEKVLLDIAESNGEGVIVAMGDEDTLALIDETCLLMKEYVDIYGGGSTEKLSFKKGEAGGRGRGPVDEYNLLCDVLAHLRQQAGDEGILDVPGPTRKFLAKDIMHWNNAWDDDAFAGGRRAGWEDWLQQRALIEDEGWDVVVRQSSSTKGA